MSNIIKRITAIFLIAAVFGSSAFAQGAPKTLKEYKERTQKDMNIINASTGGSLGTGNYIITAAIAAGSVGVLWAIHAKMYKEALQRKLQTKQNILSKALQSRDAAFGLATATQSKLDHAQRLAKQARKKAEGELMEQQSAFNIVLNQMDQTYEANLLKSAAYVRAYRTQNQEFLKYLYEGGADRIYANIERFELSENINILLSGKGHTQEAKALQSLLATIPETGDIPAAFYVKKAEIYSKIKPSTLSSLNVWMEETIVKEDLPFVLSGSKNITAFVSSVKAYESKGGVAVAREVLEDALKKEPAMAKILPKTFRRFGTVAIVLSGAAFIGQPLSAKPTVARLRANPALFLTADADTLAAAQQDKELTRALVMISNSVHEIAAMPKAEMNDFISFVMADQDIKKRQILFGASQAQNKKPNFSKYGSFSGF